MSDIKIKYNDLKINKYDLYSGLACYCCFLNNSFGNFNPYFKLVKSINLQNDFSTISFAFDNKHFIIKDIYYSDKKKKIIKQIKEFFLKDFILFYNAYKPYQFFAEKHIDNAINNLIMLKDYNKIYYKIPLSYFSFDNNFWCRTSFNDGSLESTKSIYSNLYFKDKLNHFLWLCLLSKSNYQYYSVNNDKSNINFELWNELKNFYFNNKPFLRIFKKQEKCMLNMINYINNIK